MYWVVNYSLSYNIVCVKGFSKKKFSENPKKFSTLHQRLPKLFQKFCIFVYGSKKLIIRRRRELYVLLRVCRLWSIVNIRFCPAKLVFSALVLQPHFLPRMLNFLQLVLNAYAHQLSKY